MDFELDTLPTPRKSVSRVSKTERESGCSVSSYELLTTPPCPPVVLELFVQTRLASNV